MAIKMVKEVNFDKWEEENNFGEDWIVHIPKECIKGATLLSKEEYEKYGNNISMINCSWWLRDTSEDWCCAYSVISRSMFNGATNGDVDNNMIFEDRGVRPTLILNLKSSNFDVKDIFEFGGHMFTIISNSLAICNDIIGKEIFRRDFRAKDANVYEASDVKKYVDNWFNKAYSEYEEDSLNESYKKEDTNRCHLVREVDKFAVDRISPKAKLYTEEIYVIEEWDMNGTIKNRYRIITDTLNHKNNHRNHYDEYVMQDEFWELWDIRREPDSGYNLVPKEEIPNVN